MTAPRVNLLPHRAAKRERHKKLFWALTGLSAVAGLFLVGAVWTVLQGYIATQEGPQRIHPRREPQARHPDQGNRDAAPGDRWPACTPTRGGRLAGGPQPACLSARRDRQAGARRHLSAVHQAGRPQGQRDGLGGLERKSLRVPRAICKNNSRVLERPELVEIKVAGQGPAGMNRRVFEFGLYFTMKPTPERTQMQQAQARPVAAVPANSATATAAPAPTVATAAPTPSAAPAAPKK